MKTNKEILAEMGLFTDFRPVYIPRFAVKAKKVQNNDLDRHAAFEIRVKILHRTKWSEPFIMYVRTYPLSFMTAKQAARYILNALIVKVRTEGKAEPNTLFECAANPKIEIKYKGECEINKEENTVFIDFSNFDVESNTGFGYRLIKCWKD